MGFNLGAFAGGLAQGGMQTYQMMEAIESQKKRDELIQNQLDEAKALKEASAATYGRVGQDNLTGDVAKESGVGAAQAQGLQVNSGDAEFDAAANNAATSALRENAQRQGAAVPEVGKYTREQAAADYAQRLYAINPEKAQAAELTGLQLKGAQRSEKFDAEFDSERQKWQQKTAELHSGMTDAYAKDGANGVISAYGKQLKDITGQDIAVKGDQVVLSKGGKTVDSFSVKDLPAKMEGALKNYYTHDFAQHLVSKGMFKTASDAIAYGAKKQELDIAERGVKVKEALVPSEIAKNYGAAAMYGAGGRGHGAGGAAGKAATAQQMVDDGVAPDIAAAYRIMASKDARSSVDQDWARTRLEIVKANPGASAAEIAKQKEAFYAENGVAPVALANAIETGINPQTGKPFDPAMADKLISDFNKKYPASKVDKADLTWLKKSEKTEAAKPDAAIPAKTKGPTNFYSAEASAARQAERAARDAAAAEEERKRREAADAQSAKMRSAIAADFNSKYGR